jgi:drug/metabolite transporter (DMT)-like permease
VVTVLVATPVAAPVWALPATLVAGLALAVMVLGGALRGYADIEAYAAGEAAVLAPIAYLRLVLIGIAGYLLYDEVPGPATLLGAAIIVGATLYITWRERQLRRAALAGG